MQSLHCFLIELQVRSNSPAEQTHQNDVDVSWSTVNLLPSDTPQVIIIVILIVDLMVLGIRYYVVSCSYALSASK